MTSELEGAHVLVSGLPGSGKSELARRLGVELGLPIVSRDDLLAIVLDAFGVERHDEDGRTRAQVAVSRLLLHLLTKLPSVVGDGGWWTDRHEPDLLATGRRFVQVFCSCPVDVARGRVRQRDRWDSTVLDDNYDRFASLAEPLRLPGPTLYVATESTVDVATVAQEVLNAMR